MSESGSAEILHIAGVPWKGGELTLAIQPGETVMLLVESDPEGTALLRLLLGLTPPDRGRIALLGEELGELSERELLQLRSRVGVVQAGGGLISNLRLWENVGLALDYHRAPTREDLEAAVLAALQRVGYGGSPTVRISELSLFERKQALLARALLMQPEILLCDALTTGLNPRERTLLLAAIAAFKAETQRTTLFITADKEFVAGVTGARCIDLFSGAGR